MLLLDLPNEILYSITDHLQLHGDINSLVLTCHQLYSLLNRHLYQYHVRYHGGKALLWSAENGRHTTMKKLLEEGANPNVTDDNRGFTPLLYAVSKGHETVVKLLLEWKANTELRDFTLGQTPLLTAIQKGHPAIVKLLLDNNANTEHVNNYGVTPLLFAASGCDLAVVQLLIENKADIGAKDIFGRDLVYWAGAAGVQTEIGRMLGKTPDLQLTSE